jgi:hypothetical protein
VQMIRSHGEVQDAEVGTRRCRKGPSDGAERPGVSKRRQSRPNSQRHVRGTARVVRGATAMRHAGTAARGRLATGPGAAAAPGADRQIELSRPLSHLE